MAKNQHGKSYTNGLNINFVVKFLGVTAGLAFI